MADLKKMIDSFTGAGEAEKQLKETLELLKNAAMAHSALDEAEITASLKGNGAGIEALYIVPGAIDTARSGWKVVASEKIDAGISEAVNLFFDGTKDSVKEGFKTIIQSALSALFADTTAGEQKEKFYFVTMEHFTFVRVDLRIWKYQFTQKGITDKVQQAFCYTYVKSIIDHEKVSADVMINNIAKHVKDDISKVKEYLKEMKELYKFLEGKDSNEVAQKALQLMRKQGSSRSPGGIAEA